MCHLSFYEVRNKSHNVKGEHRRDQSWFFSRYQLSLFFWDFVFSNDFVWNKAISFVIREQVLHIKIGRIFIKRATAHVESFCRRYARKQVIKNAIIALISVQKYLMFLLKWIFYICKNIFYSIKTFFPRIWAQYSFDWSHLSLALKVKPSFTSNEGSIEYNFVEHIFPFFEKII